MERDWVKYKSEYKYAVVSRQKGNQFMYKILISKEGQSKSDWEKERSKAVFKSNEEAVRVGEAHAKRMIDEKLGQPAGSDAGSSAKP